MKVVLDTNVLVSGIFFSGPPAVILRAWSQGKFRLTQYPSLRSIRATWRAPKNGTSRKISSSRFISAKFFGVSPAVL